MLKKASVPVFNVACEKRGFRCAPDIKHMRNVHDVAGPSVARASRRLKEFFNNLQTGRHTHPVVRLGFKLSRGRQTLPGRFDSCCLPPQRELRLEAGNRRLEEEAQRADQSPFYVRLPVSSHFS
jgi:hypothetical protein